MKVEEIKFYPETQYENAWIYIKTKDDKHWMGIINQDIVNNKNQTIEVEFREIKIIIKN